jgi:hypothetical protein
LTQIKLTDHRLKRLRLARISSSVRSSLARGEQECCGKKSTKGSEAFGENDANRMLPPAAESNRRHTSPIRQPVMFMTARKDPA